MRMTGMNFYRALLMYRNNIGRVVLMTREVKRVAPMMNEVDKCIREYDLNKTFTDPTDRPFGSACLQYHGIIAQSVSGRICCVPAKRRKPCKARRRGIPDGFHFKEPQ